MTNLDQYWTGIGKPPQDPEMEKLVNLALKILGGEVVEVRSIWKSEPRQDPKPIQEREPIQGELWK